MPQYMPREQVGLGQNQQKKSARSVSFFFVRRYLSVQL